MGLIYYNLPNTVDSLRSRLNVLFVEPVILLLLPYVYMSLYTADKQYYIADSSAKLYHPSAYYLAKQMAVIPFAVLNVLLFSFTLYGLAGLRHDGFAVGMNGLMSVLMYLIAAQVGSVTRLECTDLQGAQPYMRPGHCQAVICWLYVVSCSCVSSCLSLVQCETARARSGPVQFLQTLCTTMGLRMFTNARTHVY